MILEWGGEYRGLRNVSLYVLVISKKICEEKHQNVLCIKVPQNWNGFKIQVGNSGRHISGRFSVRNKY